MARRTVRNTQRRKEKFLKAYAKLGNASKAAELTGIPRVTHSFWLKKSEAYRKAFELADDEATEVLEAEALRRAVEGTSEPVYFNGVQVGTTKKYSDVLLIFLLKSKRPDVYRERYDARISANMNVQSMVKVVHEYHDTPATSSDYAIEAEPARPNLALMSATDGTLSLGIANSTSTSPAAIPAPVPLQPNPTPTLTHTQPNANPVPALVVDDANYPGPASVSLLDDDLLPD